MEKIHAYCPMPANKILFKAVIVSLLLSVFLVSIFIIPEKTKFLTCQFKQFTGYSCPSCGLTRSFHAFSHMNFQESYRFHLMGPIIYVALLFVLMKFSVEIVIREEIKLKHNPRITKLIIISFFCILFCFWFMRFIQEL
jgi:hypothetical protein